MDQRQEGESVPELILQELREIKELLKRGDQLGRAQVVGKQVSGLFWLAAVAVIALLLLKFCTTGVG